VYLGEPPVAQECVLSWCVETLRSTHTYGIYKEEVVAVHTNTTAGPFPWMTKPFSTPATNGTEMDYIENIEISVDPAIGDNQSSFGMSNDTAFNIMTIFNDVFPSFYTANDNITTPVFRFWTWKDGPASVALTNMIHMGIQLLCGDQSTRFPSPLVSLNQLWR
jgi:hypothetical protein